MVNINSNVLNNSLCSSHCVPMWVCLQLSTTRLVLPHHARGQNHLIKHEFLTTTRVCHSWLPQDNSCMYPHFQISFCYTCSSLYIIVHCISFTPWSVRKDLLLVWTYTHIYKKECPEMTWIDDNLILIGSLHKYLFDSSDEDHVNILHYLDWLEDARLMAYSTCVFF